MIKVTKSFTFDMAHLLDGHDGKCKNVHGHTYRLEVDVTGELQEQGPKKGMVVDFSHLKDIVKELIVDPMDHAFAYDESNEREVKIADFLSSMDLKVFSLPTRTTAEEMARFMYRTIRANSDLNVCAVRLWETPTSYSEYTE